MQALRTYLTQITNLVKMRLDCYPCLLELYHKYTENVSYHENISESMHFVVCAHFMIGIFLQMKS